jgi:hypothetical protein
MSVLVKELSKTVLIAILIFLAIGLFNMSLGNAAYFNKNLVLVFGFIALYTFSLSYANALVFRYLDKVFVEDRFSPKRIIIGFVSSFFVSIFVIFLLRIFEDVIYQNKSFDEFIKNERPANYVAAIIITFIITLSFYAFNFYKAYQDNRLKEQKIIAGTANAKFESLKSQIDPHFLFNSLNVLSSLIEENPDNAQNLQLHYQRFIVMFWNKKTKNWLPFKRN